ncbi:helix-turn-helix domain-containing protein [Streptomyces sp. Je 1-4]|uniref:helix-turn-helix domain-containing protein n=1 Tax=Streptomyces TaxID=1883 RepID=UPI0021DB0726|nr:MULTISPECIES: helix-turn-helix transcriptional regulator [unclassified Streptomyces]UYB40528.1 helix-turn-helix domain-containing protein [Streptomyces sp. Je 1-4]UZQ36655.1 helix-turn-helix domain-containing protein [Streptomyces sp. Je 1-4] [Streptomyces sp. Je 1-4 4N24]UZQ44072.1 helix-turn-helix domain-containing protein [Streptomyces sp. Je 1-4] [Streptomyces sp. Je 1-4 4N24_ara]
MSAEITAPGPGANVKVLRLERGWLQDHLAGRARMSTSMLGKIERGERPLTQGMGAVLANAFGITLDELLGQVPVNAGDQDRLTELRAAMRRFDLPADEPVREDRLAYDLGELFRLRGDADLSAVTHQLPGLLRRVQDRAHATGLPEDWSKVAEVYSAVYWLAARHRWMTLAELAVVRQRQAAERANALTLAVAARDEAGTFLNGGDFAGGLAVVDRALVQAESGMRGRTRHLALGLLHLRGMTLAGRLRDKKCVERHIKGARKSAAVIDSDVNVHGMHFGPENTLVHVLATHVDLKKNAEALAEGERYLRDGHTLPATRIAPLHMNIARAKLALKDRDGAVDSLAEAWDIAPQMAKVHPTSLELSRVLVSLHKRSNPKVTALAKRAGIKL